MAFRSKVFKSFNGVSLASDDYLALFNGDDNPQNQTPSTAVMTRRGARPPVYNTMQRGERPVVLTVKVIDNANFATLSPALVTTFNTDDDSLHALISTDPAGRDWFMYAKVTGHYMDGLLNKFVFMAPDGVWISSDTVTPSAWAITASAQTNAYTPGGTRPVKPRIVVTPNGARSGSGVAYKRLVLIYNPINATFTDYPIDVTGGGLDTAALVTASKMQADGDDIRTLLNGKNNVCWPVDMNTDHTKIWGIFNFKPGVSLTLEGAITDVAIVTELPFEATAAQRARLRRLPPRGILKIDSEVFTYTAVDVDGHKVTGVTRATKQTTAAAHSDAATVWWVEHEIWLIYGDAAAAAPGFSARMYPLLDLSASTNTSWVWAVFQSYEVSAEGDVVQIRTAGWRPVNRRSTGGLSRVYRGNRGANANPATEMGLRGRTWLQGGQARGERFELEWHFYHPAGATTIAMDGEKYRAWSNWFSEALLQVSLTGGDDEAWVDTAQVVAPPAAAATWEAWSTTGALGDTYSYWRIRGAGSLPAAEGRDVYFEVENLTATLSSTRVPQVSLGAEISAPYEHDFQLLNVTNGQYFRVHYAGKEDAAIVIDCENKTIRSVDGGNIFGSLMVGPSQADWLTLDVGSNTLRYVETGVTGVTIAMTWNERDGGM